MEICSEKYQKLGVVFLKVFYTFYINSSDEGIFIRKVS